MLNVCFIVMTLVLSISFPPALVLTGPLLIARALGRREKRARELARQTHLLPDPRAKAYARAISSW